MSRGQQDYRLPGQPFLASSAESVSAPTLNKAQVVFLLSATAELFIMTYECTDKVNF